MNRRGGVPAVAVLVVCGLSLVGTDCSTDHLLLNKQTIMSDGATRTYWLHVPPGLSAEEQAPLLLMLHRFTETGSKTARMTGFNGIADREGFIVAYPDGLGRTWNAFDQTAAGDVAFLRHVVNDISAKHAIDPARVFLVGASSGGYMAAKTIAEASDVFAAAALVMATMPRAVAVADPPPRAIPILFMHGTADPIIPYDASEVFAGPGRRLEVLAVPEAVEYWVAHNGCEPDPAVEVLPGATPEDGITTVRETHTNGENGSEVVLYRIEGGGHTWPGAQDLWPRFLVGRGSRDINASESIWAFLSRHSIP